MSTHFCSLSSLRLISAMRAGSAGETTDSLPGGESGKGDLRNPSSETSTRNFRRTTACAAASPSAEGEADVGCSPCSSSRLAFGVEGEGTAGGAGGTMTAGARCMIALCLEIVAASWSFPSSLPAPWDVRTPAKITRCQSAASSWQLDCMPLTDLAADSANCLG